MPNRLRYSLAAASLLAGFCLTAGAQETPAPAAAEAPAATAPLTLEDCIRRALQNGFGVEIQRYSFSMAKDSVDIARSGFTPLVSLTGSQSHSNTGPVRTVPGSKQDARNFSLGVSELLETGTSVGLSTNLNRSANNSYSYISFYNPVYNADLTVSVTQPLLRGAGIAVTTATLNRAKIGRTRAGFDFKAKTLDIIEQTENAYYSLVYAREQLNVFRISLTLANRLLEEAKTKKTVGTVTDIDVLQAQVGAANAQSNVLSGEKSVQDSSDALLAIIGRFELDNPLGAAKFDDFAGQLPVIASSYQLALHNQPDYISAKMQLDQFKLDLSVAKNSLKPTLDLDGALGLNGSRGTASDAFDSAVSRDNNSWQLGVTLSYPWGRVGDKARYRQSVSLLDQQTLTIRQLEQSILVQVRSAVRAVETNNEKVKIAALAAEFSGKQYDLESARFAAGVSTSRAVLQTQSDLENARVAELEARITLRNSISALHRLEGSSLERYHIELAE
jgi:outer membrane protein TolC